MKRLILFTLLIPWLAQAEDITGQWHGTLSVQGVELPLIIHVFLEDSTAVRQGGNDKVMVKEFPDMNHLFQTCLRRSQVGC